VKNNKAAREDATVAEVMKLQGSLLIDKIQIFVSKAKISPLKQFNHEKKNKSLFMRKKTNLENY